MTTFKDKKKRPGRSSVTTGTRRKCRSTGEQTRKANTHRLCTCGGMLERLLNCPGELTDDQVMEWLKHQQEVVLADASCPEIGSERKEQDISTRKCPAIQPSGAGISE